jgi:cyclic-di-GMP phosphodiesterase, flagellum assembly factor TipF
MAGRSASRFGPGAARGLINTRSTGASPTPSIEWLAGSGGLARKLLAPLAALMDSGRDARLIIRLRRHERAAQGRTTVRLSGVFIALCMVLIAGSFGAVLYLTFGFARLEAAVIAVAVLTGLMLVNSATSRARDHADLGDKIADLSRGTADLARQVAETGRRLAAAEAEVALMGHRTRAAIEPVSAEIEKLGNLVEQLAGSVAAHENALVLMVDQPALEPPIDLLSAVAAVSDTLPAIDPAELGEPEPEPVRHGRFKGMTREDVIGTIRNAVEASRVDLYLQPIVTLPQRKVRYYEAVTRLRTEAGELLLPSDYLGYAEGGGLMPTIDNLLLLRCVQVVRRLAAKNREIGLFCSVAGASLVDPDFVPDFSEFMNANRALASSLVLEFSQASVRAMGPLEYESLAGLADVGFRFSMDQIGDLRLEPRELADRGFRFVKVPAALLLNRVTPASDIHPADLSDLLGRFGIDLIAEKIEREGIVVDLLDFDVRFGQGTLFSPPRPVRADVLQGLAEPSRSEESGPRGVQTPSVPRESPPAFPDLGAGRGRAGGMAQLARGSVRRA